MKNYLQDLNPAQFQAVNHSHGPMLVFAGAGSGKTRVLTRRITRLIDQQLAAPENIFAVTFTNKAAKEMKERVHSMLGRSPEYVSTFHSACARILRQNAVELGYKKDFTIYDQKESLSVIKRICQGLKIKEVNASHAQHQIDRAKNNYQFSEHFRENKHYANSEEQLMLADIYDAYQEELIKSNAMDFGDLICNVVSLFILDAKILQRYRERFKFVMIDEYQDTNLVQYKLIHQLTSESKNLFVVGDDDQSIYSFRGANIGNIASFKRDYLNHSVVVLDINYRSTKNILAAANALIINNDSREKKELKTDNPQGNSLILHTSESENDEAEYIAQMIKEFSVPLSQIAIFYRTNAQSRAIEEALYHEAIAHRIYGGQRFYERKEIKDIIAYCKLAINPSDNEAFIRVLNVPTRGIGKTSLNHLLAKASVERKSLYEVAQTKIPGLGTKAQKSIESFVELIKSNSVHAPGENNSNLELSLSEFLKSVMEKSGYLNSLKEDAESMDRIENVFELLSVADSFSQKCLDDGANPTLSAFLERACLNSDLDTDNKFKEKSEYVSLMTLHLAKGLEFDLVFICGLEEGILPHSRSLDDSVSLEEERRLCYVGITRARKELVITYARSRSNTSYRSWNFGIASRFLGEIPEELFRL